MLLVRILGIVHPKSMPHCGVSEEEQHRGPERPAASYCAISAVFNLSKPPALPLRGGKSDSSPAFLPGWRTGTAPVAAFW